MFVDEILSDVENAVVLQSDFEPLILSLDEWLFRVVNLFSMTLVELISNSVFSFFAVFSVFLVALGLAWYIMRTGKSLS